MRVLFASTPAYGHLYPLMPLALACRAAGHEVQVATGDPFVDRLPVPTVRTVPPGTALSDVEDEARRRHPDAQGMELPTAFFADVCAEPVVATLADLFERDRPDLLVVETACVGAAAAAHIHGVPSVALGVGQWAPFGELVYGAVVTFHADRWRDRGLVPPDDPLDLVTAYLDPFPPSLRRSRGPGGRPAHDLRSVAWSQDGGTVPDWLTQPAVRPRVYVTLGTVSFGAVEVIRAVIDDLAALDVDVLVAAGPSGDPTLLGELPDRVRVERFVAQDQVLGLVDLVVHHGGTGTMLGVLGRGLPQVVLPQGADQYFNAETLTELGAAGAFLNENRRPGDVRTAVDAMIGDSPERSVARGLAAEMLAMPTPADTVTVLEQYAAPRA